MGHAGRYYGGCQYVNEIEEYCVQQWRQVFHTEYHCNVQPHSGTSANLAAYAAILNPGDRILAMDTSAGGHLSHGAAKSITGRIYQFRHYGLDEEGFLDYEALERLTDEFRPRLIVAGASSYSRIIDYKRIAEIATAFKAWLMVDMAHVAGLIATGHHPSPFEYADIITTTTHKTLRGPRGGMIFCKPCWAERVDASVFPGTQGGPLMHVVAAKAIAAEEAQTEEFKKYSYNVILNSKSMAKRFKQIGYDIVTGGTDNHMFLLDLTKFDMTGKLAQDTLEQNGIIVNKNMIPNDRRGPVWTSGIRIGSPYMTTKGFSAMQFIDLADEIDDILTRKTIQRK